MRAQLPRHHRHRQEAHLPLLHLLHPQPLRLRPLRRPPRIDPDRLDQAALEALRDFYTNRIDLITEVIGEAPRRPGQSPRRYQAELASVKGQLAAKETAVDKYLSDYEDGTLDREMVADRINKLSEEIKMLRYRRDDLLLNLDTASDSLTPRTSPLSATRSSRPATPRRAKPSATASSTPECSRV